MTTTIHNRFDPAKNVDSIAFRQDRVLQSAELNELQAGFAHRLRGLGDALFKNGDVLRGARIIVNPTTGDTVAEDGAIWLAGALRGVPPASLAVPVVGVVHVGVYLQSRLVTELEDPTLLNPAAGTPSYQEPGAARYVIDPVWGVADDGTPGDFYPVWTVENGFVRAK